MSPPLVPPDEAARLNALASFGIIDTPPEAALDDLTSLAATICGTQIALISLVDASRIWFKSKVGLAASQIPRDAAFCAEAIGGSDLCIVQDATLDDRFRHNPLVTGEPGIRFFAGAPLRTPEGHMLGMLCVIDRVSRTLAEEQANALHVLSRQVMGHLLMRRAIAELHETTAALRQSEQRFQLFMDHSPAVTFMKDARGQHIYTNARFKTVFGLNAEQILDKTDFEWMPAEAARQAKENDKAVLASGKQMEFIEMVPTPDGTRHDWLVSKFPMVDEKGRRILGGTAVDVTEFIRAQRELKAARDQAESATRAKTEFLANMSHEIRTPMAAILGYAGLMADPGRTAREYVEHARVIRRNGEQLLQILDDILDISKIEAGRMHVERIAYSPAKVVAEIESMMRVSASEKNLTLHTYFQNDVPAVAIGDPTRLRQILLNLVSNAIKFTQHGGVTITVSMDREQPRPGIRFDISDTGIGISPEQIANLFVPFEQADASTTRRFGGTGLGLAICRRMVHMLGGEITVASELGKGSTFRFVVDGTAASESDLESAVAPASEPGASNLNADDRDSETPPGASIAGRVLLAEDGADIRRLVTLYLQEAGLSVDAAANGRMAVDRVVTAHAAGNPYDLVLMDVQMPILDGYDATREIRLRGHATLPIIAFTAHALAGEREKCLDAGCNDYATKPIDPIKLIELIKRHFIPKSRSTLISATILKDIPMTASNASPQAPIVRSGRENDPIVSRLLPEYVADLPGHVNRIADSLARAEFDGLRQTVHQLKGSGSGYGFPEITRLAAITETAILSGAQPETIAAEVTSLVDLIRRIAGYDRAREKSPVS